MKYNALGGSGLKVSEICLGTMTWGSQNSEAEAHAQMDFALSQGVNFFDTAEMYPTTSVSPDTQGRTEEIVGSWLKASGKRDQVVIASKITGQGPKWVRGGRGISANELRIAVEGSLRRLQSETIDLYQLHWPNRGSYHFRQNWDYAPWNQDREQTKLDILEALETLDDLVKEGKIRHFGLSNESCWGTAQYLNMSDARRLPRVVSIQNEYSLMCRLFDLDLAELCHQEEIGLLAYSPLATGLLTGKYLDGALPKGSRREILSHLHGRFFSGIDSVVKAYCDIARRHGLDAGQMAIAFCLTRPFMASVIIGATTMAQLKTNIMAKDITLSTQVLEEIQQVYRRYPVPF